MLGRAKQRVRIARCVFCKQVLESLGTHVCPSDTDGDAQTLDFAGVVAAGPPPPAGRAAHSGGRVNHVSGGCLPWVRQPVAPGSVPCQSQDSPGLPEPCQRTKQGPVTFPRLAPSWAPCPVLEPESGSPRPRSGSQIFQSPLLEPRPGSRAREKSTGAAAPHMHELQDAALNPSSVRASSYSTGKPFPCVGSTARLPCVQVTGFFGASMYGATDVSDNLLGNTWLPGAGTFVLNLIVTSELHFTCACFAVSPSTCGYLQTLNRHRSCSAVLLRPLPASPLEWVATRPAASAQGATARGRAMPGCLTQVPPSSTELSQVGSPELIMTHTQPSCSLPVHQHPPHLPSHQPHRRQLAARPVPAQLRRPDPPVGAGKRGAVAAPRMLSPHSCQRLPCNLQHLPPVSPGWCRPMHMLACCCMRGGTKEAGSAGHV